MRKPTPFRELSHRVGILAAHRIPYVATASVAFPDDFVRKVQKAQRIRGTRFIHLFSPCPPGWKIASEKRIDIARLAVHTKLFPLYEVEDGKRYRITVEPLGLPVREYLKRQGRFRNVSDEEIEPIQREVDRRWTELQERAERTQAA